MSGGHGDGQTTGAEIAIVGMACRFPGARNVEEYWRNLVAGVESITYFTPEDLAAVGEDPSIIAHPDYVLVGRTIEEIDMFDAAFFGYGAREAEILDPQQRLYTECIYEALEHAGYDTDRYAGLISTYGGCRMPTYLLNLYRNPGVIAAVGDFNAQLSNDKDYVATRAAYKLNLGGASVTVQTACSTALVALHFACQSLLAGESDMAVAGAVMVRVPQTGYLSRDGDVGSPDGHVRSFDAKARGTIFGSGLGAVVVKRLEDAIADGDVVYAVIKGSAINNDGAAKVGFTAPSADGQARVIRAAQITAGVEPDTIGYVEAHGTGTPMGDPIEVKALTRAFAERTDRKQFCGIGSAKSNIGHAGAAAGVAALIKAALALRRELIPPSLLFDQPNPQIDFANSPFYVVTEPTPWKSNGVPRRAGVSAFGIGGTNAHVILEEAPARAPGSASRPHQLLVVSAKTPTALDAATARLAAHLEAHPEDDLADVAYTLQVGRKGMEHRRILVAADRAAAAAALAAADPKRLLSGNPRGESPRVVYLFSGQGAQHVGMGEGLYRHEPAFRAALDRCAEELRPHLGLDLRQVLYPADAELADAGLGGSDRAAGHARRLEQTSLAQPALFAVEYALATLWMEWGIAPRAMMGHSIGEYVAASLAGVMTLPEALALVAARGRLMQSQPPGAMLTVPLPAAEIAPFLGDRLSLAATNGPARSVVSGPEAAVTALAERLTGDGVVCRRLHTSHAFHSAMMEPILAAFLEEVRKVDLQAPRIPYVSNVSGTWITAAEATDPEHWVRHLRGTVRFAEGLATLYGEGEALLLEVGPGKTLATLARQHSGKPPNVAVLSSLRQAQDAGDAEQDLPRLLSTLGQLWANGAAVDWAGFYVRERRVRVALPTYPFERRRFWIDPTESASSLTSSSTLSRKKKELADWFYLPEWRRAVSPPPLRAAEEGSAARWLLFADGMGLADRLADHLRDRGLPVSRVEPGAAFAVLAPGRYAIDPGRRGDYESLLAELAAAGELPDVIAHLWGVGAEPGGPLPEGEVAAAIDRGFYSLLHLAQGLVKAGVTSRAVRLGVVANRLFRVHPGDLPVPEKAVALGPAKVIPQEHSNLACRSVDVVWPVAEAAADELVEMLAAELAAAPASEPAVAYRDGERWVQGYHPLRVEEPEARPLPPRLRERGVYLITGGLGGLGLVFAEHLARDARARLVLVGRTPLPARADWDAWLAGHAADDAVSGKIRQLRAIEALGAEVLPIAASVTDLESMRGAVAAARERFGALHGIVHSAGVAGAGIIQLKTREMADRVLAPKVQGTRVLDALLAESPEPLDFLLLCSSTAAVIGGVGQVDYCGANNYLDAYAQARSAAGLTVSVDWSAWQEVGMAVDTAPPPSLRAAPPASVSPASALHWMIDGRLSETADEVVFTTEFGADRHWPLEEHRILGVGALPGTTWIELARAAFALWSGAGAAPVELRDLLFQSPFMVPDGERKEARITLSRDALGCGFRIASAAAGSDGGDGGDAAWQEHARGRIAALADDHESAEIRHDLAALVASFDREVDFRWTIESAEQQSPVTWGPHWKESVRRVLAGADGVLVELELPERFRGDLAQLAIHPALLDVATSLATLAGGEVYLPFAYRRIVFRRPLPARVFSHIRRADDGEPREVIHFDILLLDDSGAELMALEGFTMKRLRESLGRMQRPAAAAAAPPARSGREKERPKEKGLLASGGMLSAEGVEAFRRVLSLSRMPQVVVSPRDLAAVLEQARAVDRSRILERAAGARAQQANHPRPDLPNPYVAPSGEVEARLAEIWQESLGIQQVGVHDNFFDLGGDSVLGVQMISRCMDAGLKLSPEQLFEHQTIAELAAVLASAPATAAAAAPEGDGIDAEDLAAASLSQAELDKVFSSLERLPS
jgi:phthiocerol/phenolphthiocerol synthesis type-I polyketide synthase E